jgi:hypothetical protein
VTLSSQQSGVNGSTCVAYDSVMAPTMIGVIPTGTLIYIDEVKYFNQSQLEAEVSSLALPFSGITSSSCRRVYASLMASSVFLPCDTTYWSNGAGIALPRLPCRSLCTAITTNCSGDDLRLIYLLNSGAFACASQGRYLPSTDNYPVTSTDFGGGVTTLCYAPTYDQVSPQYGTCQRYSNVGSICQGVIPSTSYVYVSAGMCISQIELQLQSLPVLWKSLSSDTCARHTASLLCNSFFPQCMPLVTHSYQINCM